MRKEEFSIVLTKVNDFIHEKNKKIKYCYNPMLINDIVNVTDVLLINYFRNIMKENNGVTMIVRLIGNVEIGVDKESPIHPIKTICINEAQHNIGMEATTLEDMKEVVEDLYMMEHPTRKTTYIGISITVYEKEEE